MNYNENKNSQSKFESIASIVNSYQNEDTKMLSSTIQILQNSKDLQELWIKKERDGLLKKANELFNKFKISLNVTHFYFHDTNSVNFLRVHKPNKYGDFIERATMKRARETKKIASGLELGPLGTFVLRVVVPWAINGKVKGYIELGKEVEYSIGKIHKTFEVELYILLKKEFANKSTYERGMKFLNREANWDSYENYAIIYKTMDWVPDSLESIVKNNSNYSKVLHHDNEYEIKVLDLNNNINSKTVGKLVILLDTSHVSKSKEDAMFTILLIVVIIGSIMIIILWFILHRIEQSLIKYENKAISELNLRELEQKQHIAKLFEEDKKLKNSEERLRLIFEHTKDAIIWIDFRTGKIINCNTATEILLEYSKDEIIGQAKGFFYPKNRIACYLDKFEMTISTGEAVDDEVEIETKGGRVKYVSISASLITVGNDKIIQGIFHDITERKSFTLRLQESEERFRQVAEYSNSIVWETNNKNEYTYLNSVAEKLLGYTKEELIGVNGKINFYDSEENNKVLKVQKKMLETNGKYSNLEFQLLTKERNIIWVRSSGGYIRNGENEIIGRRGISIDITDKKEFETLLKKAKEDAEKADRLKSTFLAQMSHEIRTPINSLVSLSSLVEMELSEYADEDIKTCFALIQKSGDRIVRTTDLILNLSEIEAGTYEPKMENIKLVDKIINRLFDEYKLIANEKKLKLVMEVGEPDISVFADVYTVEQIFSNLIDNAIKYTNKGSISINVFKNENNATTVEISDTGIGISEEYIYEIFKSFSQEAMGYNRKYEGNGVGLTLVKKYCTLNNANITVESTKGKGSTFRVVFNMKLEEYKK